MYALDQIESILKKLPHRMQVLFAVYCCDDVIDLIKDKASIKALDLVKQWLKDPASVTRQELEEAAHWHGDCSDAYAAASNTAYAAAYADHAASSTAYAADVATYAATYAAKDRDNKLNQYLKHLKSMIKDLSKLERVIWELE